MIDDIVDTAGTLCQAADALKDRGAATVAAYITHAVLSGSAVKRIEDSALDELFVTDTIPLKQDAKSCPRYASFELRISWPRRFAASATKNPSATSTSTDLLERPMGATPAITVTVTLIPRYTRQATRLSRPELR